MRRAAPFSKSTPWIALAALILGYLLGQQGSGSSVVLARARQADEAATPTQGTGEQQVAGLRTQAAELSATPDCIPAPTATATEVPAPTATATPVPPVAAGQPVPYGDDWTIVVTGLSLVPTVERTRAEGVFAIVGLNVTNGGGAERSFSFWSLRLVDGAGRVFEPAIAATIDANVINPSVGFVPGIARDVALVFDVAADAGEVFILESTADPTFRIEVTMTRLG